jgi:hypothetical protein
MKATIRRWLWFLLIWTASVAVLGMISFVIRVVLTQVGVRAR